MDPITMAPGNPNTDETLLGILQRLRDLSQQPLVPQNPLAQLGAVMQGFSAGTQGQQNPALQVYAQQRQQQLGALGQTATIAGMMNTMRHQAETEKMVREKEARGSEDQALQVFQGILKDAKKPEERVYAAQGLQTLLRKRGVELPDQLVTSMGLGTLSKSIMADVGLGIEMGLPDTAIAARAGVDLSTIMALRESFQSPQVDNVRKALGLRTKLEEQEEAGKALTTVLGNAKTALELQDMGNLAKMMGKDILPFAVKTFPGRDPRELTKAEWGEVGKAFVLHDMEKAKQGAALQPVSNISDILAIEQMAATIQQGASRLRDPAFFSQVKPYIGPMLTGAPTREWAKRNLPEHLAGKVPEALTDLGLFEASYGNLLIRARSGSAVSEAEEARNRKEIPDRRRDKPEVYLRKVQHAVQIADAIQRRTSRLAAVGGRAALASDVMRIWNDIPLPEMSTEGPRFAPLEPGWVPVGR